LTEEDLKLVEAYGKTNFLILEDEPDVGDLTEECLRVLGLSGSIFHVRNIGQAQEALAKEENKIGFIISDWNLEELSGLDFLIHVRENPTYTNTPFLMVTANDNVSGMLVATKKGANEYLVKPWSPEELEEKVLSCLASL